MKTTIQMMLLSGSLLLGAANAAEFTGWVSDSSCGAGNASSQTSSRECAERCIKNGAAPVFVTEADKKVYKIADPAKAVQHIKTKVKVTGTLNGDTLTITDIKEAGA
jgi:hypothetical protein